jgi:hypothetical protein
MPDACIVRRAFNVTLEHPLPGTDGRRRQACRETILSLQPICTP